VASAVIGALILHCKSDLYIPLSGPSAPNKYVSTVTLLLKGGAILTSAWYTDITNTTAEVIWSP
jgi:hypothetical protein